MKKLFLLLTAVLVICAVGIVQPVAAETLRVGAECTYFPFNYRGDDGVLTGYDIDVATGIAEKSVPIRVCLPEVGRHDPGPSRQQVRSDRSIHVHYRKTIEKNVFFHSIPYFRG